MTFILRAAVSLAALAAATSATAQTAPAQTAPAQTAPAQAASDSNDVVVTAQRENRTEVTRGGQVGVLGDKDAADVPFSIRSYNAALILNQQPQTLGQVLENDPSIRTTYGFGNAAEAFVIRGFVLDGDDVGLNGLYGIAPRQLIAPELYDSVQVLNGASAFLNGAAPGGSGIGGSVNLVTKRAGAGPLDRLTVDYTGTGHVGGSADLSRRFGPDGAFGVRLNGVFRAGDVATDGEYRRTALAGAGLDYRSDRLRASLDLGYQDVAVDHLRPKVTIASATTPAVPAADHNYGQRFAYTRLRDIFGTARIEYDVTDHAMLYLTGGARDGSERGLYDGITVTDATTGAATGTALYVPRTDNNEAVQGGLRVKLAAPWFTSEINVGGSMIWQVNRNAYDFRYGGPTFPGFATNLYQTPQVALPSSSLVGGNLADPFPVARNTLGSAFASNTLGFLDGHILVTGGLRLQTITQKSYDYSTGALSQTYRSSAVTPVVGVVVKPVTGVSLFANRIEALVPGAVAPAGTVNVGQVFAPFRSTQYEVGGKLALARRVNASLALFQTDQPSAYSVALTTTTFRYGVFGLQRNRGIELSVDGEIADGLRLIAGGSVLDAKLRDTPGGATDGQTAVGVPTYLVNANAEWDLPFLRGFTLTGRVVNTGRQEVNAANTLRIPAWTRFDAGARYVTVVADRPLTLRFTVDNVAGNRYWASAFDTFSAALLQGAPRTFKLSASIDL